MTQQSTFHAAPFSQRAWRPRCLAATAAFRPRRRGGAQHRLHHGRRHGLRRHLVQRSSRLRRRRTSIASRRTASRFTQAYANSAVCSATRTALITGRYQYRLPIGLEEPLPSASKRVIGLPPDASDSAVDA